MQAETRQAVVVAAQVVFVNLTFLHSHKRQLQLLWERGERVAVLTTEQTQLLALRWQLAVVLETRIIKLPAVLAEAVAAAVEDNPRLLVLVALVMQEASVPWKGLQAAPVRCL